MRASVVLLLCSLLGVAGGAALIGRWAVGCAIIFDALCTGAYALLHDDGHQQPAVARVDGPKTVQQVLDGFRNAA